MGAADAGDRQHVIDQENVKVAVVIGYDDELFEIMQVVSPGDIYAAEDFHERAQQDQVKGGRPE